MLYFISNCLYLQTYNCEMFSMSNFKTNLV